MTGRFIGSALLRRIALTPKASSLLVMAIFGGAVIPQLQGVLADRIGVQLAFLLPLLCYAYIAWYALRGSRPALRLARMSVPG
jgi:FHS family L-fucose permease-like MFS transporter